MNTILFTISITFAFVAVIVLVIVSFLDTFVIYKFRKNCIKHKDYISSIILKYNPNDYVITLSKKDSLDICKLFYDTFTKYEKFFLTKKFLVEKIEINLNINMEDNKIIFNIEKEKLFETFNY